MPTIHKKIFFYFMISTLSAAYASEPAKPRKNKTPYDNCGWNCLGWVWSDKNIKKNILPLENSSKTMAKLNAYTYTYTYAWDETDKTSLGLIAQNVEQADPRLVRERESGLKQVYIPGVIALLVAEVKSLRAELNDLTGKANR